MNIWTLFLRERPQPSPPLSTPPLIFKMCSIELIPDAIWCYLTINHILVQIIMDLQHFPTIQFHSFFLRIIFTLIIKILLPFIWYFSVSKVSNYLIITLKGLSAFINTSIGHWVVPLVKKSTLIPRCASWCAAIIDTATVHQAFATLTDWS